jgi:lipoprotein-releasing system permease protein
MKRGLILEIAKAMMLARGKQSVVAAVGVVFSISMFIALLGFMNGLNSLLDGLILNRTPHIRFYNEIKPKSKQPIELTEEFNGALHSIRSIKPSTSRLAIYNSESILDYLKKDSRVLGLCPKIATQVFFNVGTLDLTGVLNGIDWEQEVKLFAFQDYIVAGEVAQLDQLNTVVLGKGLAERMLARVGDRIQITTAKGSQIQLKVVGLFQSGLGDFDNTNSYSSLATVQKILGQSAAYVTDIQVKLHDLGQAPALAKEFAALFEVDADDIQTVNSQFETGSQVRTIISYAVGVTLLIVAGFGIYNILNMMIYEKLDSIAILKAIGFSPKDVNRIFISIALIIGLLGSTLGLLVGYLLSLLIDQIPFETDALPTITTYPIDYNPKFYLIGGVFGLLTTYLAGYFPAKKAASIDPVEIIRGK